MEYLPLHTTDNSLSVKTLYTLKRAISRIGEDARPEAFMHIQPHAHATARLVRQFAGSFEPGDIGMTLKEIECGAYLHDIGKYFIQDSVLLKPGVLDEDERTVMQLHPVYGGAIMSRIGNATESIRRVVLYHHEHWDGTGYPDGLSGTSIPLEARLVAVVDVYTSLRSRRSYKPTLNKEGALKFLVQMAGRELDPYLVEDFIMWISCIGDNGGPAGARPPAQ
jgi:putative two-component system response regulator